MVLQKKGSKTAQPQIANGATNRKPPVAPPVYRPQVVPKVLQRKISSVQPFRPGQPSRPPVAPPVYRPESPKLVQPKSVLQRKTPTAPPVYRPKQNGFAPPVVVPAKLAGPLQMKTRPVAPPVYRPQPIPKVLQTKAIIKPQVGPGQQQHQRVAARGPMPAAIQRSRGNVVQRDVDVTKTANTENGEYHVDPRDTTVLYSEMRAPEPKPRGLYMRWIDRTVQHPRRYLYGWRPNVRFLSKAEQGASPSRSKPGSYEYIKKGLWDSVESFSLRGLGRDLESPPMELDRRPTVGVFGKNDCYAFADTLQNLIIKEAWEETGVEEVGRTKKTVHVTRPDSPADLRVGVGDMMRQIYKGSDCRYHAATVVAEDGNSVVTLEGHVSKDLQRPEFLIHNGVAGFADEPIRRGYGDEVEVTPLETLKWEAVESEREASERRYQRITGEDPTLAFHAAGSNLGITPTDEVRRRAKASRRLRRQLQAIYDRDRDIHLENQRRAAIGAPKIPLELSSFPPID